MFRRSSIALVTFCLLAASVTPLADAGIRVYESEDGDRFVEIGARIQIQYLHVSEDPRDGQGGSQDTDGYQKKWYANDIGINYFFNQHKAKAQLVYRMESNVNGQDGDDRNQLVMQWQFVF